MSTSREPRIAIGGILQETDTFSPLPTRLEDFEVWRGEALLARAGLDGPGATLVPTLRAHAMPGGVVEREAYLALRDELLAALRAAGPVDGVCLDLHGAMEVAGVAKAEADLLQAVREVVGPAVPIAAGLDLHANLTPSVVEAADVLTAYRTAPHRDALETRRRALALLLRCLREGLRPRSALVKPPLVLVGERAVTDVEPMAGLMRRCVALEAETGILSAVILVGCAWADVPHVTTSVVVTAADDAEWAAREARALAAELWARRSEFAYEVEAGSIDACLDAALAAPERPVFITDSGDNPTAGAPGDVPLFLERLIARGVEGATCAAIPDEEAVAACFAAGAGAEVTVRVGGKLDAITAPPLEVTGRVQYLAEGAPEFGRLAVLRVGGVEVVLTVRRAAFTAPEHFHAAGIDPLQRRVVVVKQGYLFSALREIAPRVLMALSPGLSDLRIERLPYKHLPRPVYPLDMDMEWAP